MEVPPDCGGSVAGVYEQLPLSDVLIILSRIKVKQRGHTSYIVVTRSVPLHPIASKTASHALGCP